MGPDKRARWFTTSGPNLVFGRITDDATPTAGTGARPQAHVLMSYLKSGTTEVLADQMNRPTGTQFQGMDGVPGWVAWVETTSEDLFQGDWAMYSLNTQTMQVRLIARAPDVGDGPAPTAVSQTMPQISGRNVYFGAVSSIENDQPVTSIYEVPLDGSSPMRILSKNSNTPNASVGKLAYIMGRDLVLRDLATRKVSMLGDYRIADRRTCGWAYNEGTLATCTLETDRTTGKGSSTFHIVGAKGEKLTIGPLPTSAPIVQVSSRWVAFTRNSSGGSQVYIYDLAKRELHSAGILLNVPEGNGDEMIWHTLPPKSAKQQSILASEVIRLK
jgi:Tol biopolymer transport system component